MEDGSRILQEGTTVPRMPTNDFYSDKYKMDHRYRGKLLIINNGVFKSELGLPNRKGSDIDANVLSSTFRELGFKIDPYKDLTVSEMIKVFRQVARDKDDYLNQSDCFACAILSHGSEGSVYGKDARIELKQLMEPFTGSKCRSLVCKPKLFFIQACQGTKIDHGADVTTTDAEPFTEDVGGKTIEDGGTKVIPSEADFLVAHSTVPGYYAWKNEEKGSWFIQALCQTLKKEVWKLDLMTIMTRVNKTIAQDMETNCMEPSRNRKKQIPCVTSMLTKDLYFTSKGLQRVENCD